MWKLKMVILINWKFVVSIFSQQRYRYSKSSISHKKKFVKEKLSSFAEGIEYGKSDYSAVLIMILFFLRYRSVTVPYRYPPWHTVTYRYFAVCNLYSPFLIVSYRFFTVYNYLFYLNFLATRNQKNILKVYKPIE